MISENDLQEVQEKTLAEQIERIENLLEGKNCPRAFELSLLLALKMAKELQDGKELGSESGEMVATWTELYPASIVEEAIIGAKEFLLNPSRLADKIKETLLNAKEEKKDETKTS